MIAWGAGLYLLHPDDMSSIITTNLVEKLLSAVEPVQIALTSKENYEHFLAQQGVDVSLTDAQFQTIKVHLDFGNTFEQSQDRYQQSEEAAGDALEIVQDILALIQTIIVQVKTNTQGSPSPSLPAPLDQDAFWQALGRETLDRLTYEALETELPILAFVLLTVGVAEIDRVSPAGANRILYEKYVMNWEKLGDFLTDPLEMIQNNYDWGNSVEGFNFKRFQFYLYRSLNQVGFFPRFEKPESAFLNNYFSPGNSIRNEIEILKVPFLMELFGELDSFAEVGFQTMPIPERSQPNGKPMGFTLAPLFKGGFSAAPVETETGISLKVSAGLETDAAFRVLVLPSGIDFESDGAATSVTAEIALVGKPESPFILIGTEGSHRLELDGFLVSLGFKGPVTDPEFIFKAGTGEGNPAPKLRFVFQAGESDGFLKDIIGTEPQIIDLSAMLIWSSTHGFGFEGTTGFSILLPLHLGLGPVSIDAIAIDAAVGTSSPPKIGLGLNISGNLGPLAFVIDQIGAKMELVSRDATGEAGLLGNLDMQWGFQPPKGAGLSIDAGVVKGGGFIRFYPEKGEYSGALELTFSEIVSLKAIGIINTKMPDGSDGFSLLVIISAEFGSGIQLGFGFTLLGVGGLLGLNRTMKLDALATGVRTGAVDGIMFPTNIIENAPRIISDLQAFFPVQQDRFLIGPMAKLGWGTPTLISISLGIIIEIPGNIAILGILKIVLPTEEASLIKLQVNFIGAIEFDKERLWFFASMYDSRIIYITLEGEMGLLVGWGAEANFVSSVGGFHPAFKPPVLPFPSPVRISLSILNESWGKIRVMGYFAVTSNTAQFGASAELYFGFSALKIEGHIGFDALFQFSPFYMIIQLSASLSVKVFGIGLFSVRVKMSLEGPSPWYAHGTGSISLLFFDIDVDFDFTWGEEKDTTLPPISIMPLLVAEYEKQENWKALVPANNNLLVSLREIDPVAELVLHPVGTLQVSQRAIPLQLTLDKMGSQKPDDANSFSLEPEGSDLARIKTLDEDFAIAQFKDLKDAEKLSSPAFQPIEGGMELSAEGDQLKTGKTVKRHIRYELITIDTNYKRGRQAFFKFLKSLFGVFLRGNTVARAEVSYQNKKNLQPFDLKIKVAEQGFSVANTSNNTALDAKAHFSSQAQAKEYMQAQLVVNPELEGELHVLPNNEINTAA
jgi:hypothetical protein